MGLKGWSEDIEDRIEYFPDGTVDEAVMVGANVHIETLDDSSMYLIMDNGKHYWNFAIFNKSHRAKVEIKLMEDSSPTPNGEGE